MWLALGGSYLSPSASHTASPACAAHGPLAVTGHGSVSILVQNSTAPSRRATAVGDKTAGELIAGQTVPGGSRMPLGEVTKTLGGTPTVESPALGRPRLVAGRPSVACSRASDRGKQEDRRSAPAITARRLTTLLSFCIGRHTTRSERGFSGGKPPAGTVGRWQGRHPACCRPLCWLTVLPSLPFNSRNTKEERMINPPRTRNAW